MSNDKVQFTTPVGRLVSGSCFIANTTDSNGNPMLIKSGPNIGQPTQQYSFGIAFPKTNPEYNALWAKIHGEASRGFPQYFDATGSCILPTFSFKVVDGDSQIPNTKNNKPCDREGYPGHWVVFFSGSYAPKCYTAGGASLIIDPEAIKKGYYVRVVGSVVSNGNDQKPGVYVNHSIVELIGYGAEISSGPDAAAILGANPVTALPPGASATPLAPSTVPAGGAPAPAPAPAAMAPAPAPAAMAPAPAPAPAPAAPAPAPGQAAPAPATDFLNPAVAEASHNVNGAMFTVSQLKAAGHSDAMIATYPLA